MKKEQDKESRISDQRFRNAANTGFRKKGSGAAARRDRLDPDTALQETGICLFRYSALLG